MKRVGLFEAKAKLSEICNKVAETGVAYVVTKRNKPLVKIVAVDAEPDPVRKFSHLSMGEARKAYEAEYGKVTEDFELPPREMDLERKNPLDE
ncbi:MAG: type II toxin-antitoxin system Phd/YefM family antitoxin [Verrucomicrobiae bacterium]|nr:type II toxin-antitoxin system Phd/YefM family antitoxin [Verrucomicrobiae bacterium]